MDEPNHGLASSSAVSDQVSNPVAEIGHLLNLTVAQIELAIQESNVSVETLANSFTDIADGVEMIAGNIRKLSGQETGPVKKALLCSRDVLLEKLNTALVAIQYHDRLIQRLRHISRSLNSMADMAGDATRLHWANEWSRLKSTLRENYPGEAEKVLFDTVIAGADTRQGLRQLSDQQQNEDTGVELF